MKNIKIINGTKLSKGLLLECIALDSLVYGHMPEMIGVYELVEKCIRVNPEFFLVAMHEGRVLGYLNSMPISYKQYLGLKSGCLSDPEIFKGGPERIEAEGKHRVYVSSLVVHPSHQDGSILLKLLTAKQALYEGLKQKRILIECELSEVVTDHGKKCAKRLGWSLTGKSKLGYPVFEKSYI